MNATYVLEESSLKKGLEDQNKQIAERQAVSDGFLVPLGKTCRQTLPCIDRPHTNKMGCLT